jgi:hypothetical protein
MRVLSLALIAAVAALSGDRAYGQDEPEIPPPAIEEVGARSERSAEDRLQTEDPLQGSGIPSSPYPAGLSYMMTPQPFRVPYPNRFSYPPAHYVRQCPYYAKGVYWGADWNKRLLGCNPWLVHGDQRFNPYLTEAKIRHHSSAAGSASHSSAPCVHCQQSSLANENPPPEADEFEIPRAPVAARKKVEIPLPPRSSLTVRAPLKRKAANAEPDDVSDVEAEPDEFAPAPQPRAEPKNRLVRQTLPAWQRAPAVRR